MTFAIQPRRILTVAGVVLALLLGVATVRAAAAWASSSASLQGSPPPVGALQDALAQEQARSAALQDQLDQLTSGSTDLQSALEAAQTRITTDADQAAQLRAALADAKTRLASLERSIRSASAARATTVHVVTTTTSVAAPPPSSEHESEPGDD